VDRSRSLNHRKLQFRQRNEAVQAGLASVERVNKPTLRAVICSRAISLDRTILIFRRIGLAIDSLTQVAYRKASCLNIPHSQP
jgi:hypothetical protein